MQISIVPHWPALLLMLWRFQVCHSQSGPLCLSTISMVGNDLYAEFNWFPPRQVDGELDGCWCEGGRGVIVSDAIVNLTTRYSHTLSATGHEDLCVPLANRLHTVIEAAVHKDSVICVSGSLPLRHPQSMPWCISNLYSKIGYGGWGNSKKTLFSPQGLSWS